MSAFELQLLVLHAAAVLALASLLAGAVEASVPAMFMFGDSTADVGNNNYLPGGARTKANFPHNGVDFPGGVPTGRFSNGYIGVDFLGCTSRRAHQRHFPISISSGRQELRGVNYASAGSGIFDVTAENESLSMNEQVARFEKTVARLVGLRGRPAVELLLRASFFGFSTGNNDLFEYFRSTGAQNRTQNAQLVSSLITQFRHQLKKLYGIGARKFGVFGAGLLGFPPALRRLTPGHGCVGELNELALGFNAALSEMLRDLSSASPGMRYSIANSYNISSAILENPEHYGFTETMSACCGSGLLNAESYCLPNATLCADRSRHLSWDYVHPTEAAYRVIAGFTYGGSGRFAASINFGQLARI